MAMFNFRYQGVARFVACVMIIILLFVPQLINYHIGVQDALVATSILIVFSWPLLFDFSWIILLLSELVLIATVYILPCWFFSMCRNDNTIANFVIVLWVGVSLLITSLLRRTLLPLERKFVRFHMVTGAICGLVFIALKLLDIVWYYVVLVAFNFIH